MKQLSRIWNAAVQFAQSGKLALFSSGHTKKGRARIGFFDRMLLKEYERLKHALEQESDPARQEMMIDDLLAVEEAMKNRRALAEYLNL